MFIDCKMAILPIFHKVYQKSFSLADIFQLQKYQVHLFINVPTTRKRELGSGKFKIWKVLIVNWWSFHFSMKIQKSLSCVNLKEIDIAPAIFFKTVVQN